MLPSLIWNARLSSRMVGRTVWIGFVCSVALGACSTQERAPATENAQPAASTLLSAPRPRSTDDPAKPVRSALKRDAAQALRDACATICSRSTELKCANGAQCLTNCLAMAALTPCSEPVSTMYACLVRQPAANWECAEDGVAAIREGFCDREQERAVTCMEAKMQN